MARLDTWKPEDKEEWGEELDSLLPNSETLKRQEDILVRKAKEFQTHTLFLERRATKREAGDGLCQYCLTSTRREFCGETCEKDAALAALPIKFHTKGG